MEATLARLEAPAEARRSLIYGTDCTVLSTQITAPGAGLLLISASSDVFDFGDGSQLTCIIALDGATIDASARTLLVFH